MEEVWTVVQSYGTQSILKVGLNRPLMREVLDKLDECEGRMSELLIDSATDESEVNSLIKMTPQGIKERWCICQEPGKERCDRNWRLIRSTR